MHHPVARWLLGKEKAQIVLNVGFDIKMCFSEIYFVKILTNQPK